MKGPYSYLMSAVFFSLCLPFTALTYADENVTPLSSQTSQNISVSREDRLLLLSNVASLWKLNVKIGKEQPKNMTSPETFGLVKNGQLSPSFVARAALQISLRDENSYRTGVSEWEIPPRPSNIPERYDMRISYKELELTALEWLGYPFDTSFLPEVDCILQKEDSLYIETQALLNSWPCPAYNFREHDIFAQPYKMYQENNNWILEGEIWDMQEMQDGTLNVTVCDTFRLEVKKAGRRWRILSLDFNV